MVQIKIREIVVVLAAAPLAVAVAALSIYFLIN
jgi:hypothetical protein